MDDGKETQEDPSKEREEPRAGLMQSTHVQRNPYSPDVERA
jgi:hypothetical protein